MCAAPRDATATRSPSCSPASSTPGGCPPKAGNAPTSPSPSPWTPCAAASSRPWPRAGPAAPAARPPVRGAAWPGSWTSAGRSRAEAARRLACDARILPVVLGGAGEPLDVGRAAYIVPTGLRRALIARDRGCAFPGCDRPPHWCHAHHNQH